MAEPCQSSHLRVHTNQSRKLIGDSGLDFAPTNHADLPSHTPTIVICHGLTGGSHESYVRNIVVWAIKPVEQGGLGARAVVVNVGLWVRMGF